MDNINRFNITHPSNTMLSVVTGTIGAVGAPGNLFLALLILSERKKRKPHEWILFVLAVTDFFMCLDNALLESIFITRFDRLECKIAAAVEYYFGAISLTLPPLVAYNRYLSLYDQARFKRIFTNRNVFWLCSPIICYNFLWILPFIIQNQLGQDDSGLCGTQVSNLFLTVTTLVMGAPMMGSSMLLAYLCYKVVLKVRNHKRQVGGGGGGGQDAVFQSRLIAESSELIIVMITIGVVPLITQTPAVAMKFLEAFIYFDNHWLTRIMISPFCLTSTVNPYITLFVVKSYRRSVVRFYQKLRSLGGGTNSNSSQMVASVNT